MIKPRAILIKLRNYYQLEKNQIHILLRHVSLCRLPVEQSRNKNVNWRVLNNNMPQHVSTLWLINQMRNHLIHRNSSSSSHNLLIKSLRACLKKKRRGMLLLEVPLLVVLENSVKRSKVWAILCLSLNWSKLMTKSRNERWEFDYGIYILNRFQI